MHRTSVLLVAAVAWFGVAAAHKRIVVKVLEDDDSDIPVEIIGDYSDPLEPTEEARDILDAALENKDDYDPSITKTVCISEFYGYEKQEVRGTNYRFHVSGLEIPKDYDCARGMPYHPPNYTIVVYQDYADANHLTVTELTKV